MTVASQHLSETTFPQGAARVVAASTIDLSYSFLERAQLSFLRVWDRMFRVREGMAAALAGGVLIVGVIFLAIAAYRIKSAMGIDLLPGIHASDVMRRL